MARGNSCDCAISFAARRSPHNASSPGLAPSDARLFRNVIHDRGEDSHARLQFPRAVPSLPRRTSVAKLHLESTTFSRGGSRRA